MAVKLQGQFWVRLPNFFNPLDPDHRESVEGANMFERVQKYMDSIPRLIVSLNSVFDVSYPIEIESKQGKADLLLSFKTRKFLIHARVSVAESESFIQFFRPISSRESLTGIAFNPTPEHLNVSLKMRKIEIHSFHNFDIGALLNVVKYMPHLEVLSILESGKLSLDQFRNFLSSTGAIEDLDLEIDHLLDESDLREARHGRLKKLGIVMPNSEILSNEVVKIAIHAIPTLNELSINSNRIHLSTYNCDKGFEYKENRLVPLSGKEDEELEQIEKSKTAVFRHMPNLDTFDGAKLKNLFTKSTFQSVKVLHISGDYML